MDFHSLARRDLQALCKKNKIPANITNVAMAEALKALETVEGIEELMKPSQSEAAQSSTESLEMPEATSPFVPPTAGRSTRRTNIAKEAAESVNPTIRTRRTTRKTQVKDADAIETPALMAQTNRKMVQMASARRNMNSQLKECENEDKKEFSMTPALIGGTSRRRKVEESGVKKIHSTRQSVRLAEKSNVKKELVAKDGDTEEMNLSNGVDNFNELSAVENKSENKDEPEVVSIGKDEFEVVSDQKQDTSDVDAIAAVDEKSENKDEPEDVSIGEDEFGVVSDQKQDTSVVKDEFEGVSDHKQDESIGEEIIMGSYDEEEKCTNFEMEAKREEEKCDIEENMPLNVSNEVQQNDDEEIKMGSYGEEEKCTNFETEAKPEEEKCDIEDMPLNVSNEVQQNDVEKSTEELKPEEGEEASQHEAADFVENVKILESRDKFVVDESSCDNTGFHDEVKEELNKDLNVALVKLTELALQQSTQEADSNFIDHSDISVPNEIETLQLVQSDESHADQIQESAIDVEISHHSCFEGLGNEPNKIETLQLEEIEKSADSSEQIVKSGEDVEISNPIGYEGLDSRVKMTIFSDNKENVGNGGGKLVIMRDVKMGKKRVENVENLDEFSVRKLTKMLKEKLEITKKSSKNENGNEATSRPALQVLPENRLVDDTQN